MRPAERFLSAYLHQRFWMCVRTCKDALPFVKSGFQGIHCCRSVAGGRKRMKAWCFPRHFHTCMTHWRLMDAGWGTFCTPVSVPKTFKVMCVNSFRKTSLPRNAVWLDWCSKPHAGEIQYFHISDSSAGLGSLNIPGGLGAPSPLPRITTEIQGPHSFLNILTKCLDISKY